MGCFRRLGVSAILPIIGLIAACSDADVAANLVGTTLPPLENVTQLDGAPASVLVNHDKIVVLNIWATWCGPCRRELPSLEKLKDGLNASRVAVLGLSIDEDARQVTEYLASKGVTYPNMIDLNGAWVDKHGLAQSFPSTLVVGRDGKILAQVVGERVWHTARTVAALEQAWRDGKPVLIE